MVAGGLKPELNGRLAEALRHYQPSASGSRDIVKAAAEMAKEAKEIGNAKLARAGMRLQNLVRPGNGFIGVQRFAGKAPQFPSLPEMAEKFLSALDQADRETAGRVLADFIQSLRRDEVLSIKHLYVEKKST